jgi:hypothetical protein
MEAFTFSIVEQNKLQFPMKEDCDDVIMDSSGSNIIEAGMKMW